MPGRQSPLFESRHAPRPTQDERDLITLEGWEILPLTITVGVDHVLLTIERALTAKSELPLQA